MDHGHGIKRTRIGPFVIHFLLHLLHHAFMLLFDECRPLCATLHRIFNNRLPLELFGPSRRLRRHPHGMHVLSRGILSIDE